MKLEINMIVKNAKEAAKFYKKLFDAEILSETDLEIGLNEVRMVIADTSFRILDENIDFGFVAPAIGIPASVGFNMFVNDIYRQADLAKSLGCVMLSPVTEFPEQNAINAVFTDVYGHTWVLNQ